MGSNRGQIPRTSSSSQEGGTNSDEILGYSLYDVGQGVQGF
jgi:hypothetical protein